MTAFLSSAAFGWFLRRILDWGGWLGGFLLFVINTYNNMPPALQAAIVKVVEGNWQEITLGSLIPLGALVWSQIVSFRATVKPQVVIDGQQVPLQQLQPSSQKVAVEELARTAIRKRGKTLMELLAEKLGKR